MYTLSAGVWQGVPYHLRYSTFMLESLIEKSHLSIMHMVMKELEQVNYKRCASSIYADHMGHVYKVLIEYGI